MTKLIFEIIRCHITFGFKIYTLVETMQGTREISPHKNFKFDECSNLIQPPTNPSSPPPREKEKEKKRDKEKVRIYRTSNPLICLI